MDFLDFIRKVAQEKKEQGYVVKGGKGSGWFGPPGGGTHTANAQVGGAKRKKLKTKMTIQRASKLLSKKGYELGGGGEYNHKTKETSYKVKGPDGKIRTMTAKQVEELALK